MTTPAPGYVLCACCRAKEISAFNFLYGKYPKGFKMKPPRCPKCKHHVEPCAPLAQKETG